MIITVITIGVFVISGPWWCVGIATFSSRCDVKNSPRWTSAIKSTVMTSPMAATGASLPAKTP